MKALRHQNGTRSWMKSTKNSTRTKTTYSNASSITPSQKTSSRQSNTERRDSRDAPAERVRRPSRMIVRIQPHVLRRKIGRPEPRTRFAFFENEHDARVAVGGDRFGRCIGIEI